MINIYFYVHKYFDFFYFETSKYYLEKIIINYLPGY